MKYLLPLLILIFTSYTVFNNFFKKTSAEDIIKKQIKNKNIGGAVLLVQKNNKVIYLKAFGKANESDNMTISHTFDLASLTKVYATTMGIMLLYDSGKIKLDDPVSTYLNEFNTIDKKTITIRQLLNHTSGLQEWKPLYYHVKTSTEAIEFLANLPLKYSVGKERRYSDFGFMILGALIERVSGQKLSNYLKDFYRGAGVDSGFGPVTNGLVAATSIGNAFEEKMVKNEDFGYKCTENFSDFKSWRKNRLQGEVNDGNSHHVFQGVSGHAGLFSTVKDLNRLANVLINKGNGLINEETIAKFTKTNLHSNGLGWAKSSEVLKFNNHSNAYGHYGFTGTTSIIFPDTQSTLHLLTNRQFYGLKDKGYYDVRSLTKKLVKHFKLK